MGTHERVEEASENWVYIALCYDIPGEQVKTDHWVLKSLFSAVAKGLLACFCVCWICEIKRSLLNAAPGWCSWSFAIRLIIATRFIYITPTAKYLWLSLPNFVRDYILWNLPSTGCWQLPCFAWGCYHK